jgi:hypothetical protein
MANLPGIDNCVEISAFKNDPKRYEKILDVLITNGHSFAVHGGMLYFSVSGMDRLFGEGLLTDG